MAKSKQQGPKVLLLDIETAPILARVWGMWDQNVGLNQIKSDWFILSFSAKWLGDPASKTIYADQRNAKDIEDDTPLLKKVWNLLDEADILITQNGIKFDTKKLNSRFVIKGFQPPSSFKNIDTLVLAKKHFGFTSNKLEYMTDKLCTKYKKNSHKKFSGFELWKECLAGNKAAWKEMELYNKLDVLSLEELYYKLIPWDSSINFNLYSDSEEVLCKCGSSDFIKRGFFYTNSGKFQRYRCNKCGAETRSKENLFNKDKKKSLRTGTVR